MENFSIEIDTSALAERLKGLRKQLGLTQQELARELGLKDATSISNFEKGIIPTVPILIKLCEIYGKSLNEILYGKEEEGSQLAAKNGPALALYREYTQLEKVDQRIIQAEMLMLSRGSREARDAIRSSFKLIRQAFQGEITALMG